MTGVVKPEEYFPKYNELKPSEQTRLAELASLSNLLVNTTVENMQYNVRIPITHFNFFAPYFLGVKEVGDTLVPSPDALRNMWHACCKSLQHDVDVIDETNNSVLFTVPAYIDTDILNVNPAKLAGDSFDRMRRKMEAERNFPEEAVNTYQIGNNKRVDSLIQPEGSQDRHQRKVRMWAKIYAFYNVDVTKLPSYKPNQNVQNNGHPSGFNAVNPFGTFGGFDSAI